MSFVNSTKKGMGDRKIAIISLVHGDEIEGKLVSDAVETLLEPHDLQRCTLYFVTGNDHAYAKNTRFIAKDLNRVFPGDKNGVIEERIAAILLPFLQKMDFVIDLHSTPATGPPFLIATSQQADLLRRAQFSAFDKLCIMSPQVATGSALIDHCHGLSVEMNVEEDVYTMAQKVLSMIRSERETPLEVYQVESIVRDPIECENFVEQDGWYPLLAGETDYDFTCLRARKVE